KRMLARPSEAPRNSARHSVWVPAVLGCLLLLGFRPRSQAGASRGNHHLAVRAASGQSFAWVPFLRQIRDGVTRQRVVAIAAGVTFYSLLAVFPAIAALVASYGLVADPGTITQHLDSMSGFMPEGAIDVIRDQITAIGAQSSSTL